MKTLTYKRNWAYEQHVSVFFVDGTEKQCLSCTDNKGRIEYIEINGTRYTPEQFAELGISYVLFMTPASLEVKSPVDVLVSVYKRLGETICEGDLKQKVAIRERIVKELRSRGINLHEVM